MAKGVIMAGGGGGTGSDELTAMKSDVLKGKTAVTSDSNDEAVSGTLELAGDASDSHVLSGKTYYNTDAKVKRTGTMTNNGAKTEALNCGGSYTIPAGYHNGSGKVTANSLSSQTGVDSGKTAAAAAQILTGCQAWVNGAKITGTMANQGAKTAALSCGGSYTIPAGYHNGSGKVTANSLASQTSADATAASILAGKTAWVNGVKITGTLAVQSALSFNAAVQSHDTIRISWKNPAKGPWQGVKIRMATSGYPGVSGGTLKYTGTGSSAAANGESYVDITGLSPNTTYYFTCYSYATGLSDGAGTNVTAKTAQKTPTVVMNEYFNTSNAQLWYRDSGESYARYQLLDLDTASGELLHKSGSGYVSGRPALDSNEFVLVYDISKTAIDKVMTNEDAAVFLNYTAKVVHKNTGSVSMNFGKITEASAFKYTGDNGYTYYAVDFHTDKNYPYESWGMTSNYKCVFE